MSRQTGGARQPDFGFFPPPEMLMSQQYYYVTLRFWPSLLFVLPMLIVFEVGMYVTRGGSGSQSTQLVAAYLIERLINVFGASGHYLPWASLLVVAILLACHLVSRQQWKFDIWVLAGMLGESLIWTVPLFILDRVMHTALLAGSATAAGWREDVIRSFGAGILEEMVFRFMCMNVLHIILADLLRIPRSPAGLVAIVLSALIFAAQHHPPLGAEPFNMPEFAFRTAAGLYLAGLYFFRGFGIAAGCHSFYNVFVATLLALAR